VDFKVCRVANFHLENQENKYFLKNGISGENLLMPSLNIMFCHKKIAKIFCRRMFEELDKNGNKND
jgi:hypothetical protein